MGDHRHSPHEHRHHRQHDHGHHDHGHHDHGPYHHHSTVKNLRVALLLNLSFALVELVGGLWTGSLAIVADAIHDFGDASALGLAILLEVLAARRATRHFTYGYRRLSLLSAAVTAIFLLSGSLFVAVKSIERLQNPQLPHLPGMLGFAVLGVVVNGYAAWRLSRGRTLNERVVSWHLVEDVLGWVAVLVGSVAMMIFKVPHIDPILSLAFSAFIIWSVSRQFVKTLRLFMQGMPDDLDQETLKKDLLSLKEVKKIHDMHVWSLDGVSHVLTVHVVVEKSLGVADCIDLKRIIRERLQAFGKIHATIEIEWLDEVCSLEGQNCHDHESFSPSTPT